MHSKRNTDRKLALLHEPLPVLY